MNRSTRRRREREWVFRPVRDRLRVACDCGRRFEAHTEPGDDAPHLDYCPACGRATTPIEEPVS